MISFMTVLNFQQFSQFVISIQIFCKTILTNVNTIFVIMWRWTTYQAGVCCISNFMCLKTPTTAIEIKWTCDFLWIFWLNIFSTIFGTNLLEWGSQKNTVFEVIEMFVFLNWFLFNAISASEVVWVLIPLAPIKRIWKLDFAINTLSVFSSWRYHKLYNIFFNCINCWINFLQMIL